MVSICDKCSVHIIIMTIMILCWSKLGCMFFFRFELYKHRDSHERLTVALPQYRTCDFGNSNDCIFIIMHNSMHPKSPSKFCTMFTELSFCCHLQHMHMPFICFLSIYYRFKARKSDALINDFWPIHMARMAISGTGFIQMGTDEIQAPFKNFLRTF